MPSVTISLDEIRAEQLGDEARAQGLSVSKLVRKCIDNYFEEDSEHKDAHAQLSWAESDKPDTRLEDELKHKNEMIQEKDNRIRELNEGLNFLRMQYAELVRQNMLLLPVAGKNKDRKWLRWPWSREKK